MVSQTEYNILLNKYNIVVSQNTSLKESIEYKEVEYKKINENNKRVDKAVREFCSIILAKDKDEMTLSGKNTWSDTELTELVKRVEKSYKKNEKERNTILNQLMSEIENRGEQIETLKQQINIMVTSGNYAFASQEELEKVHSEQVAKELAKEKNNFDENVNTIVISEDEEECDEEEIDMIADTISDNTNTLTGSVFIKHSNKKKAKVKEEKTKAVKTAVLNLHEKTKNYKDVHWDILKIIGDGAARIESISSKLDEKQRPSMKAAIADLRAVSVEKIQCKTPYSPNFALYILSTEGKMLYEDRFGEKAKVSEVDKIKAEHTTLEHGYTIVQIASRMKDSHKFNNISAFNRNNPIRINGGTGNQSFVPDIVYEEKKNDKVYKNYIEYETGDCLYQDLSSKITKMFYCTKYVQIIVPSKAVLNNYVEKIKKYIEEKEGKSKGTFNGKRIRLCTAKWYDETFLDPNYADNKWEVEFDFKDGIEPKYYGKEKI